MGRAALLYDADCAFCTRTARFGDRLHLATDIVPLHSVDLNALGVDEDRAIREIPFIDEAGAVAYGADAIAGALRTGSAPWRSAAWILRSWPMRHLAEVVYGFVARHRHQLPGGTVACEVAGQSGSSGVSG